MVYRILRILPVGGGVSMKAISRIAPESMRILDKAFKGGAAQATTMRRRAFHRRRPVKCTQSFVNAGTSLVAAKPYPKTPSVFVREYAQS